MILRSERCSASAALVVRTKGSTASESSIGVSVVPSSVPNDHCPLDVKDGACAVRGEGPAVRKAAQEWGDRMTAEPTGTVFHQRVTRAVGAPNVLMGGVPTGRTQVEGT